MYTLSIILTIIGLVIAMSCLGAFPGYPKKSKARKQIIVGVGVGLLFVFLGHQGCQRSYKNVRLAGPEKVAAHFVKSTGEMRYVDPEIRGTERSNVSRTGKSMCSRAFMRCSEKTATIV